MAGQDSMGGACPLHQDGAIEAGQAQMQGQEALTWESQRGHQMYLRTGTLSLRSCKWAGWSPDLLSESGRCE